MMLTKSITELAAAISRNTQIVNEYFVANNIPLPSFDVNGPAQVTIPQSEHEVAAAHAQVISDAQALHNLMKGPTEMVMGIAAINVNDVLSLQAMHRFKLADRFQLQEKVSFDFLSQVTGVNVTDLRRLIRHAMTNHIFYEEDGLVGHTAASRVLRENIPLANIVGILTEELFLGAAQTLNALVKYKGFHAPNQSGFSLGHNTDKGLYEELRQFPERASRFARAMEGWAARLSPEPLARGWDWASVDGKGGTVVDVGGGWGPVSISLAKLFPNIKFIVQDFADVVAEGPQHVPSELKGQIEFMDYNFLEGVQPVRGAAVYYLRAVLHNWPEEYCVIILRNILPVLEKGAHILVQDIVVGKPGSQPPYVEKYRRSWDLNMTTFFGARERTFEEWEQLVKEVNPKLSVCVYPIESSHVLDITWKD